MIYPYQVSDSFKSFVEDDPILYSLFSQQMRWGDVEDFENKEILEVIKDFVVI